MLNILFNPKKAERHPIEMMFIGIFYSSLSILIGGWVFPGYSPVVIVFLTVLSCLYVVQGAIKNEEKKERDYKYEWWILREHQEVIVFILFLFLGFVISFSLWAFFLSPEKLSSLFKLQSSTILGIRNSVGTGNVFSKNTLSLILLNNFKVLFISLILAFFYGAGAIFVLVWNASVMGVVIGTLARDTFGLAALPIAFFKYSLHGIPEMLAYLIVALTGGILYVAVVRGDFFKQGKTKRIILDSLTLIIISAFLLILAGLIEVYISPLV